MATLIPLVIKGAQIGDLITVGHLLVLFTVKAELHVLDGKTFASTEAAVAAVTELTDRLRSEPAQQAA